MTCVLLYTFLPIGSEVGRRSDPNLTLPNSILTSWSRSIELTTLSILVPVTSARASDFDEVEILARP